MERVHAALVIAPGTGTGRDLEDELRSMVREQRGAMYEPAHLTFVPELPLTDAGKPDKKQLRLLAGQAAG